MNIRSLIITTLLLAVTQAALAVDVPARLYFNDGSHKDVLILSYKEGFATYKLNAEDLNRTRKGPAAIQSIYFYEVPIFTEAMALYQGRKYAEAKVKFLECEEAFKAVDTAPNNYATLAAFYAMECSRRLFKLDDLSSEMEKFSKGGLTRENHLQQLEVNAFWEAARLKDWEGIDRLAQEWRTRKVTGDQRVQISYCHGLAYEQLAQKNPKLITKALNAYNICLSADFTASIEIVVAAASNALHIYSEDPKVKFAIKSWGGGSENQNGAGFQRLQEANALAKFYNQAGFATVKPLSADAKAFLRYETPTAAAPPAKPVKKAEKEPATKEAKKPAKGKGK